MTEWILSSSVLLLIIIALRYCLKGKISLRLQYALWGLVLVRLLLPFNIGSSEISVLNFLPESIRQAEVSSKTEVIQGGLLLVTDPENTDNSGPEIENEGVSETSNIIADNASAEDAGKTEGGEVQEIKSEINLSELWNVVWIFGGLLVGSVLLAANVMFAVRLKKSRRGYEVEGTSLSVYLTEAVDTPCLFGLFRPAIYLTPAVLEKETSLRHILEHETTHYHHKDHIWAILRGICLAVHWYNPLVWWAAALSRADAELACDEATIQRIGEQERAEYGRTLISMTCQKRAALFVTATTMTGSKNGIRERISLIVKKPKMAACTLVVVIVLATVAVGCTFTGDKGDAEVDNDITPTVTPTVTPVPTMTETVTPDPAPTEIPIDDPTPTVTLTPTPTAKPEFVFDIEAELLAVEVLYKDKRHKLFNDPSLNQADMNTLAGECATLWEEAMTDFWNVLEPLLTAEAVGMLQEEQQEWLKELDAEIQMIIDTYDGGSIAGLMVGQVKAERIRERVYKLADYLTRRLEQMADATYQDYSGHYVNNQGTDVIYDELELELLEDGTYHAEIGIFRLTTLEGTAVVYGDMLVFEDTIVGVKGNIHFLGNGAVFTVTESYFEYITPGEGFEFTKSE